MPSLDLSDRLIWFAHCPKAGGTSIEQIMVANWGDAVGHLHWGWDIWWRRGGWRVADPPNSPQHLVWSDAMAQLPRAPDAIFALVRDPAARIASEYRWQRQGRRGSWLGKSLAYLPFPLWLRLMLAVGKRNANAFDNHLRSQADFVPDAARVFRLEDGLEKAVLWLSETVGHSIVVGPAPHAISTSGGTVLTEADLARIASAYDQDYARFRYETPSQDVIPDWSDQLAELLAPLVVRLYRMGAL